MIHLISGCTICGLSKTEFTPVDGTAKMYGYNVYFTYPLTADGAEGDGTGRLYVGVNVFKRLGLSVGVSIDVARGKDGRFDLVA